MLIYIYIYAYVCILRIYLRHLGSYQGRIQDLKLGVAQMDWKIWKAGVGKGWGYCVNIFQIYVSWYVHFNYDVFQMRFFIAILYIYKAPLYNNIVLKILFEHF